MGIVERKLREREQRVQEILNAARVLFMTKGYSSTTMLDIAEESELSRRTIYLYFKSKEELSYRVMKDAYALLLMKLQEAQKGCNCTAYEKLELLKSAYMDFYKNDFDQLVFTLLFDYRINSKEVKDTEALECFKTIQSIITLITTILEEGQADKSIVPLTSPLKSGFTYMTMIQSTMQKLAVRRDWLKENHGMSGKEIIEEMFLILFSSLKAV